LSSRVSAVESWPTGTWSQAYSWGNHASAGYAPTGTVGAIDERLLAVEAWPTGTWTEAHGWGDHASAGYTTGTPWTLMGYIGAAAATSAAEAVIAPYTGSIASAVQPTHPAYTNTSALAAGAVQSVETLTNWIVVADAGGTNEPSNPLSWGLYNLMGDATNQNGWLAGDTAIYSPPIPIAGSYNGTNIPGYWIGNGEQATGTVYVTYLTVTNTTRRTDGTVLFSGGHAGDGSGLINVPGNVGFFASGTNILIIIGGTTNRVVLEAYSGE
jgi:hypothetical protein